MLIPDDAHNKKAKRGQFDILAKLQNSSVRSWTKDPKRNNKAVTLLMWHKLCEDSEDYLK